MGRCYKYRKTRLGKKVCKALLRIIGAQRGIEIPGFDTIGGGLKFGYGFGITVHGGATIGEYCTLMKGCTIGGARGKRAGTPTLGNNVYVGINATVVGGITVGDDVFIAANTFVNFDVPPHSLVIGSPGVIHQKAGLGVERQWHREVIN